MYFAIAKHAYGRWIGAGAGILKLLQGIYFNAKKCLMYSD